MPVVALLTLKITCILGLWGEVVQYGAHLTQEHFVVIFTYLGRNKHFIDMKFKVCFMLTRFIRLVFDKEGLLWSSEGLRMFQVETIHVEPSLVLGSVTDFFLPQLLPE